MKRAIFIAAILLGGSALAALLWIGSKQDEPTELAVGKFEPGELERGQQIYAGFCASCHGAQLEGQPDWKTRLPSGRLPAPPHDASGHTWHHPDAVLFRLTKEGVAAVVGDGYESDMPGFGSVLSDDEIRAVLNFIKSTWPERERQHQAKVSLQEKQANQ